jgi:hypothetical protein
VGVMGTIGMFMPSAAPGADERGHDYAATLMSWVFFGFALSLSLCSCFSVAEIVRADSGRPPNAC